MDVRCQAIDEKKKREKRFHRRAMDWGDIDHPANECKREAERKKSIHNLLSAATHKEEGGGAEHAERDGGGFGNAVEWTDAEGG